MSEKTTTTSNTRAIQQQTPFMIQDYNTEYEDEQNVRIQNLYFEKQSY